jgi:hypothetical protein
VRHESEPFSPTSTEPAFGSLKSAHRRGFRAAGDAVTVVPTSGNGPAVFGLWELVATVADFVQLLLIGGLRP